MSWKEEWEAAKKKAREDREQNNAHGTSRTPSPTGVAQGGTSGGGWKKEWEALKKIAREDREQKPAQDSGMHTRPEESAQLRILRNMYATAAREAEQNYAAVAQAQGEITALLSGKDGPDSFVQQDADGNVAIGRPLDSLEQRRLGAAKQREAQALGKFLPTAKRFEEYGAAYQAEAAPYEKRLADWKSTIRDAETIQAELDYVKNGSRDENGRGGILLSEEEKQKKIQLLEEELFWRDYFDHETEYTAYARQYDSGKIPLASLHSGIADSDARIAKLEQEIHQLETFLSHPVSDEITDQEREAAASKITADKQELAQLKSQAENQNREYNYYWSRILGDMQENPNATNATVQTELMLHRSAPALEKTYRNISLLMEERGLEYGEPLSRGMDLSFVVSNHYEQMTDDECRIFLYCCNLGNYDAAKIFLDELAPVLEQRHGQKVGEKIDIPVIREAFAFLHAMDTGIKNIGYGVASLFADVEAPELTSSDYAAGYLQEANKGSLAYYTTAAAANIGNQIPRVMAYAVNPMLGKATTFLNARGNAYVDAKRNGASHAEAWMYSTMVGASETCLEMLLGAAGGRIKGALPKRMSKWLSSFGSKSKKIAPRLLKDFAISNISEIIEEDTQNYLEPAFAMFAGLADSYDAPGLEEFLETTIVTVLSSSSFYASNLPAKAKQLKFNETARTWAQKAVQVDENGEIGQYGKRILELLEAGRDISPDYMSGIFALYGDLQEQKQSTEMEDETAAQTDADGSEPPMDAKSSVNTPEAEQPAKESTEQPAPAEATQTQKLPDWAAYEAAHKGERYEYDTTEGGVDQTEAFELWRDGDYFDALERSDEELAAIVDIYRQTRNDVNAANKNRAIAQYHLDAYEYVQAQRAQKNAALEQQNGGMQNAEGLNDGGQRNEGVGAGGQGGAMEGSASRSVSRGETRTQAAIIRDLKTNGRAQSAKEIGIQNGGEKQTVYVLSEEQVAQSESWSRIRDDAEADGARVVFMVGAAEVFNKSTKKYGKVEGVHLVDAHGQTTYYIRVDKLGRNAEQIYQHEKFHELVSTNPGLMVDLMDALDAQCSKQEIAAMVNSYVEAYHGIYGTFSESMTEDEQNALVQQYMNEVFADVYAGIKRGTRSVAAAQKVMRDQTDAVQRAEQNSKAMRNKTAPPSQRFSFAGERAKTANLKSLQDAKQLLESGAEMETIRMATGWHQGKDGKWRFEIDDSKMKFHRKGDARFEKMHPEYAEYQNLSLKFIYGTITEQEVERLRELGDTWKNEPGRLKDRMLSGDARLSDILAHDALFQAYPELEDVAISFRKLDEGEKGHFDKRKNTIVISETLRDNPETTLLHEIQHAIQRIEGFASGSSPEYWLKKLADDRQREVELADKKYRDIFDSMPEELKNKVRAYNRANLDYDYDEALKIENELLESEYGDLFSAYQDADFDRRNLRERYKTADLYEDAITNYRNTAGEIEARDTAQRMTMDANERKKTSPNYGDENTVLAERENDSVAYIGKTTDNTPFVEVTDDILAGVPMNMWISTVTDNLNNKFPNGVIVGKNSIQIDRQSRREMTYSRYTAWLRRQHPSLYEAKLKATNNADEILKATTGWVNEALNHPRNDNIEEFARGKVLIRIGGQDYSADVVVGKRTNGDLLLYDILQMNQTAFHEKETDAAIAVNPSPGADRNTASISDDMVSQSETDVKQEFSFDDDVEELDENYARRMEQDDAPEGLAPADDEVSDYHRLAKNVKEGRAQAATMAQLKNRIQSSEQAVQAHRAAKDAAKKIGALTKELKEQLDKEIELIRETLQVDRAELKRKQAYVEQEEKEKRKKKEQAEIQNQRARTAQKEIKQDLLNLFSVKTGVRFEIGEQIDRFTDELVRSGKLTNEDRRALFEILYAHGEEIVEADEYFKGVREFMQQGRIYVPESVRADFGDDWQAFQSRAWGNRIYLTKSESDGGIDMWAAELAGQFGDRFTESLDPREQLEMIVDLAEEGKAEHVTLAEMMQRNEDDYGWSVAEQMEELERKVDRMLETFAQKADLEIRLRQQSVRQRLNEQEYFRKTMERKREAAMESKAREQVHLGLRKLEKERKIASPSQRRMIDEVLRDFDTAARSFTARGLENLQELKEIYDTQKEKLGDNFLRSEYIEKRLERLTKKHVDDLSIDEVRDLGRAISCISNAIQNSREMVADAKKRSIEAAAKKVGHEISKAKGSKSAVRALHNLVLNHMDAKRFFGHISGWVRGTTERLGEMLSWGQERTMRYQMNAMRIFDNFLADEENQKWLKTAAGKNATWIKVPVVEGIEISKGTIGGKAKEIEITPMMRISLLMHSFHDANLRHIQNGIKIPDKEMYLKGDLEEAYARGKTVKIQPAAVKAITKGCTPQERAFAKLLQNYFDGYSKSAINEVSLKLEGFERANVEHYYHLKTVDDYRRRDVAKGKQKSSAASPGSVVNERTYASNPIVLQDATDALMEHIDSISKYYGYAMPIRDVNAVLTYVFHEEDEAYSGAIGEIIGQKWGAAAKRYIENLIDDLNEPGGKSDILSDLFTRLRGNYAKAVISANLSSLLKQTTSYPVAYPYLKASGLIAGLKPQSMKADVKTLEKYSAVYWFRNQGNSTMELSDALKSKDFGDRLPWVFNLTQKMDSGTTRRILAACEYRVRTDMGLVPGTQAEIEAGQDRYWTEVAKLFNEVVLKTQSNSTAMERPQITRANASNISRFMTMFRTDAFQQLNMMFEAKGRVSAANRAYKENPTAANKKAKSDAKKFAARTISGTFVGQLGCAAVAVLLKFARLDDDEFRDEEGNLDWWKISSYVGLSIVESYCGFVVCGELVYTAAAAMINDDEKWYDIEFTGVGGFSDAIESVIDLGRTLKEADLWRGRGAIREAAFALSKCFGFPAENLEKYLSMGVRWFAPEWTEMYENIWNETTKASLSRESRATMDEAIGVLMDNRTENLSDEDKSEIARLFMAGGTGSVPSGIPSSVSYTDEDGEEVKVELSASKQRVYRKKWSKVVSSALPALLASEEYADANDEHKTVLIDKLYKYATQIARNAVVPEKELDKWVVQGETAIDDGVPLAEYICFRVGLTDIDGKNEKGETVDGLKGFRDMELLEAMGWTDRQEKNVYLDVLASDSKKEQTEALMKAGLTWEQTNDIIVMLGKKWDKMAAIAATNASEAVKAKALEVYASDKEKKLIRTGLQYGLKMSWYTEVKCKASTDGKDGVTQAEAREYILDMDLTWQEKIYLWQMVTDQKSSKCGLFEDSDLAALIAGNFYADAHADDPKE